MEAPSPTVAVAPVHPDLARRALRMIAIFEAVKGIAALLALIGVLDLMDRDVRHLAMELIGRFHLNPDGKFPSMLLHYAELLPGADVNTILGLGSAYIAIRLAEGYGLWFDMAWGEWLGALSGALYVPFEVVHLMHRHSWINLLVLLANVAVVAFLVWRLVRRRRVGPVKISGIS